MDGFPSLAEGGTDQMSMKKTQRWAFVILAVCLLAVPTVSCREAGGTASGTVAVTGEQTGSGSDTETESSWMDTAVTVDVEGLSVGDETAATKNLDRINDLIDEAKPGTILRLPGGDIYLASDPVSGGIQLIAKEQIALMGQSTNLINVSYDDTRYRVAADYQLSNVFTVLGCQNVYIGGLTVSYRSPSALSGQIIGFENGRTLIRPLSGNSVAGGEYVYCVSLFNKDGVPGDERYLSETSPDDLIRLSDGTYSYAGTFGEVGNRICLRFTSATYAAPLFNISGAENLELSGVMVHGCPGAVCIATGANRDWLVERMRVVPPEDVDMLFSSNQDGFHLKSMRGSLTLRDCTFIGLGDDALNTHSLMGRVESVGTNTASVLTPGTGTAITEDWAAEGDEIALYDDHLNLLGTAHVTRNLLGSLTLDSMPDGVGVGTLLHNRSNAPDVTVTGCHVERSRARAFLLQCRTAVVQDCTLKNIRLSGILAAPDTRNWYEMGPVQAVTVTGCRFERVGTVDGDHAAVCVRVCHDSIAMLGGSTPIHGSVSVSCNTFLRCKAGIFVRRAASTEVHDNSYENCRDREDIA